MASRLIGITVQVHYFQITDELINYANVRNECTRLPDKSNNKLKTLCFFLEMQARREFNLHTVYILLYVLNTE